VGFVVNIYCLLTLYMDRAIFHGKLVWWYYTRAVWCMCLSGTTITYIHCLHFITLFYFSIIICV